MLQSSEFMRLSVIASLGTSPPVVTEFISWIMPVERVDRLILLATNDPQVLAGARLIETAIKRKYPQITIRIQVLKTSDILSEEDNLHFLEEASRVIISEMEKRPRKIYICLAGGRKEMVTSLMLLAQVLGADGVFHVVSPHIREMNVELERLREEIAALARSEDPIKFYEERSEIFDALMFPDKSTYNVVKIPIIPYPRSFLEALTLLARRQSIQIDRIRLPESYLKELEKAGLIHLTQKKVIMLDEARKLINVISRALFPRKSSNSITR